MPAAVTHGVENSKSEKHLPPHTQCFEVYVTGARLGGGGGEKGEKEKGGKRGGGGGGGNTRENLEPRVHLYGC